MRYSPVTVVLFAIVFAAITLPLLTSLFTNIGNVLAVIPIPQAETEVDLGKDTLKAISDWLFTLLMNPLGLTVLVAISLVSYAATQAVRPK